jgi:diguanylate cyclase (GGDEF)-like protein/PAS domain S-box-containing protein
VPEAGRTETDRHMPVIQQLQKMKLFKLWLLTVAISVVLTEALLTVMERVLTGRVTSDYLVTGLVASLVVSAIVVAGLWVMLATLEKSAELQKDLIEKLRNSEARTLAAIKASNSALWDYDLVSGRVHLSEAWAQFLGEESGEADTDFRELAARVPAEDREAVRPMLVRAVKGEGGSSCRAEYRVRKRDGSYIWVRSEGRVVERDAEGRALRMTGIIHNITERKQAETEYRTIVQTTGDAFWMVAAGDGRILEVNPAACAMSGYSREEMLSMHVSDIEGVQSEVEIERNRDLLISGVPLKLESRHRRKDGAMVDVEVSARYMDVRGGVIVAFIRDISARNEAEREFRIAAAAFESQEGMLITDAESRILRVNNAFTEITGYQPEEVIGRDPNVLNSGRHDRAFYDAMWRALEGSGAWSGEIWNRRKNGEVYPEHLTITAVRDASGNITNYVASMADITSRKQSEAEIQRLAYYDHLTNLPNRRLLLESLKQALAVSGRGKRHGALLFIDLDNFKTLNDTLGHDFGDLLLRQAAARLMACVREGDGIARLGGDEFVVILLELSADPLEASEQAKDAGETILAALAAPFQLGAHAHACTASIGITLFFGRSAEADELLKQGDIAMYHAKHAGRNTLRFFDQKMQESINVRAAIESELRQARARDELELYYQPQVDAKGRPQGAEVLLRWRRPGHGLVPPAEFIGLAEETGLIVPIGAWAVDQVCARIAAWKGRPGFRNLTLAVNISSGQFHREDFVEQVRDSIRRHDINPLLLKLELTESLALADIESTIRKMATLKGDGVNFSLDDFGTGYSSLAYLKRLPLNQLKIDQSFVRNIASDNADKVMVMAIASLGMNFELNIAAEGVETEMQFKLLHRYGCDTFQGYLFSQPLPVGEFEDWVSARAV